MPLHQTGHAEGSAAPGMCPLALHPSALITAFPPVTLSPRGHFLLPHLLPSCLKPQKACLPPQQLPPPCAALPTRGHCYPTSGCRLERCGQAWASHGWGTFRISGSQILQRGEELRHLHLWAPPPAPPRQEWLVLAYLHCPCQLSTPQATPMGRARPLSVSQTEHSWHLILTRWLDGWMDGQVDGQMEGWTVAWMDG